MALTTKPEAAVSAPNSKTAVSASTAAIPNSKTAVSAAAAAIPNSKTTVSAAAAAIPNSKTTVSAATSAIPNTKTAVSAATAAIPNAKTTVAEAGFPRALTPLVNMDFAAGCYSQCGSPVLFDDLFTYSRSSSASFINRRIGCNGGYEYFLDADYVGDVENLVTYSEQFDNSDWTKLNATITADTVNNPVDGMRTADKFSAGSTATIEPRFQQSQTTVVSSQYTHTLRVKKSEATFIQIWYSSAHVANNPRVNFDIANGVIGSINSDIDEASIKNVGDGFYEISSTVTAADTTLQARFSLIKSSSDARAVTNSWTAGDGVHVFGAQMTESAKPLPYVKTISTAVTETFAETLRTEYDPETGAELGALIEGSNTNLQVRSEEFDNASWSKTSVTITPNEIKAPDDTRSADKIVPDNAANGFVSDQISFTSGEQYTASIYAKSGEFDELVMLANSAWAGTVQFTTFNLSTVTNTDDATNPPDDSNIEHIGNGWYRCSITVTATSTTTSSFQHVRILDGDGSSGLYIWGAQVEESAFATSYIRTESSSVTRAADDLSISNAGNIPSGGDMSVSAIGGYIGGADATPVGRYIYDVNEIGSGRSYFFTSNTGSASFRNGGAALTMFSADQDDRFEQVGVFASTSNLLSGYDSGVAANPAIDAGESFFVDAGSFTGIGSSRANTTHLYGHIKTLSIYDKALTAQEVSLL